MPTLRLERLRMSEDHSGHHGPLSNFDRLCRCPGPRRPCTHWPDHPGQQMGAHCDNCHKYFKAPVFVAKEPEPAFKI